MYQISQIHLAYLKYDYQPDRITKLKIGPKAQQSAH